MITDAAIDAAISLIEDESGMWADYADDPYGPDDDDDSSSGAPAVVMCAGPPDRYAHAREGAR
jgi:hypothetical protein